MQLYGIELKSIQSILTVEMMRSLMYKFYRVRRIHVNPGTGSPILCTKSKSRSSTTRTWTCRPVQEVPGSSAMIVYYSAQTAMPEPKLHPKPWGH